jgi:hypothetical protein
MRFKFEKLIFCIVCDCMQYDFTKQHKGKPEYHVIEWCEVNRTTFQHFKVKSHKIQYF